MTMLGFENLLRCIKEDPRKTTLKLRYLALVADLPSASEKISVLLKLAEFYRMGFPKEALQIAYLVCRYDNSNVPAIEIIIEVLELQGKDTQARFMSDYLSKIRRNVQVSGTDFLMQMHVVTGQENHLSVQTKQRTGRGSDVLSGDAISSLFSQDQNEGEDNGTPSSSQGSIKFSNSNSNSNSNSQFPSPSFETAADPEPTDFLIVTQVSDFKSSRFSAGMSPSPDGGVSSLDWPSTYDANFTEISPQVPTQRQEIGESNREPSQEIKFSPSTQDKSNQDKSNQDKSNQDKSNQDKSNQDKSNQDKSNAISVLEKSQGAQSENINYASLESLKEVSSLSYDDSAINSPFEESNKTGVFDKSPTDRTQVDQKKYLSPEKTIGHLDDQEERTQVSIEKETLISVANDDSFQRQNVQTDFAPRSKDQTVLSGKNWNADSVVFSDLESPSSHHSQTLQNVLNPQSNEIDDHSQTQISSKLILANNNYRQILSDLTSESEKPHLSRGKNIAEHGDLIGVQQSTFDSMQDTATSVNSPILATRVSPGQLKLGKLEGDSINSVGISSDLDQVHTQLSSTQLSSTQLSSTQLSSTHVSTVASSSHPEPLQSPVGVSKNDEFKSDQLKNDEFKSDQLKSDESKNGKLRHGVTDPIGGNSLMAPKHNIDTTEVLTNGLRMKSVSAETSSPNTLSHFPLEVNPFDGKIPMRTTKLLNAEELALKHDAIHSNEENGGTAKISAEASTGIKLILKDDSGLRFSRPENKELNPVDKHNLGKDHLPLKSGKNENSQFHFEASDIPQFSSEGKKVYSDDSLIEVAESSEVSDGQLPIGQEGASQNQSHILDGDGFGKLVEDQPLNESLRSGSLRTKSLYDPQLEPKDGHAHNEVDLSARLKELIFLQSFKAALELLRNTAERFSGTSWWKKSFHELQRVGFLTSDKSSRSSSLNPQEIQTIAFQWLESTKGLVAPHEYIREILERKMTPSDKDKIYDFFFYDPFPGMEVLQIDVYMALGASLEAAELIRHRLRENYTDVEALARRARMIWYNLGWQPFYWQPEDGSKRLLAILSERPNQRASADIL